MILALDIASLVTALAAAWFWFAASRSSLRRVSQTEEINHHDLNRLIVAFNRTQILNSRAALATAVSALFVAARFAAGIVQG